jgi:hypothetical protein
VSGLLKLYGIRRVFIIGAGFNAPLGMSLTRDLLKAVHSVARTKRWHLSLEKGDSPNGQADWLVEQLKWYFPLDEIDHDSIAAGKLPKNFDIENFLSYAAASSAFVRNTSQQWNAQGDDKFIMFLKSWIAEAIVKQQQQALAKSTHIYNRFVCSLSNSLVLTFNWDTLIESFFEANHIKYSFDLPATFKNGRIPLIKLHGSVDWFAMPHKSARKEGMSFQRVSKLSGGCFRAKGNLLAYYNHLLTPRIIIPSFDKISQISSLGMFWQTPWMFLQDKLEVVLIGFSMRPDDFHTRAFIYPQLVEGSRSGSLSVKVVDYAKGNRQKKKIKERFAGVKNCKFFFDGFSGKALDFIESS